MNYYWEEIIKLLTLLVWSKKKKMLTETPGAIAKKRTGI